MLRAKLFGTPSITLHAQSLDQAMTGRRLALFAYLLVQEELCTRNTLIDLFWTGIDESQAKEYLRGLLYGIRQAAGNYLQASRYTVAFNRQAPYWTDVEFLRTYLSQPQTTFDPTLHLETMRLYQGEFLEGIAIRDAPVFDLWLTEQRRSWHSQALRGWQQLVNYHLAQRQYAEGLVATRQLLALEAWHEEAHRQQMFLLAMCGEVNAALAQYETCSLILREKFNKPPNDETTRLYEQIKNGDLQRVENLLSSSLPLSASTLRIAEQNLPNHGIRQATGNQEQPAPQPETAEIPPTLSDRTLPERSPIVVDWGSMPRASRFFGRQAELNTLSRWAVSERCRVVAISGAGGQGKTALAAHFVQTLSERVTEGRESEGREKEEEETKGKETEKHAVFERIIWRSLLTAPPLDDILQDWLQQLSEQQVLTLPRTFDQKFTLLSDYLHRRRFLLVLDNVESILHEDGSGLYRSGYETYGQLWQLFVQHDHQSCLLLTTRERLSELGNQEERPHILRTLLLDGLSQADGRQLLRSHGIMANETVLPGLLQSYSGHPLALKLVADVIDELFDGNVAAFLQEETPFFADIADVLEQQFNRLSPLEQEVITWLALEQEPVSSQTLYDNFVTPPAKREFLAALRRLVRRSLVQPQEELFSLQNVILEYARNRLIDTLY